jgi:hypothetical protein
VAPHEPAKPHLAPDKLRPWAYIYSENRNKLAALLRTLHMIVLVLMIPPDRAYAEFSPWMENMEKYKGHVSFYMEWTIGPTV